MKMFRWIVPGILGGALYYWLATLTLKRTYAIAWPDWFAPIFEGNLRVGVFVWDAVVSWVPCLLIAVIIGTILRVALGHRAIHASIIGAAVALLCVAIQSAGSGEPMAAFNIHVLAIVAILPLGVTLAQLHNKSFNSDASDAGAG